MNRWKKISLVCLAIDLNGMCVWCAETSHWHHFTELTLLYDRKWREECDKKSKPSLLRALTKTFWPEYLLIGILNLCFDVVAPLIVPFLLKNLLEYFRYVLSFLLHFFAFGSISFDPLNCRKDSHVSQNDALVYGTAICAMTILPGLASSHSLFKVFCTGQKVRVGVCSLIYHKVSVCVSQINDKAYH